MDFGPVIIVTIIPVLLTLTESYSRDVVVVLLMWFTFPCAGREREIVPGLMDSALPSFLLRNSYYFPPLTSSPSWGVGAPLGMHAMLRSQFIYPVTVL